jgi:hypothetical protein
MPGTSTTRGYRLLAGGVALVAGTVALLGFLLAAPASSWAASASGPGDGDGPASLAEVRNVSAAGEVRLPDADREAALGVVTAGVADGVTDGGAEDGLADGGVVAGQAAGVSADLSVESVSEPPALVPWIVIALLVLVIAGAVRAYGRSPQRAAVRSRRTP